VFELASLKGYFPTASDLVTELDSVPVTNRATQLTLQALGEDVMYMEGLYPDSEVFEDDAEGFDVYIDDDPMTED
jgi:hypothetical protein